MSHVPPNSAAVNILLQDNPLKTSIGPKGDYEVRTSIIAERSCCRVYQNGLEVTRFPPVFLELSSGKEKKLKITKSSRTQLAQEIAQAHFRRCEEVERYVIGQNKERGQKKSKIIIRIFLNACLVSGLILLGGAMAIKLGMKMPIFPRVSWPVSSFSTNCKAGSLCIIDLPKLDNKHILPLNLSVADKSDFPDWLNFDPDALRLVGMVPTKESTDIYLIYISAEGVLSAESRLLVELNIQNNSPSAEISDQRHR